MIFNTIKDLISWQPNCPICNSSLHAFLKERAVNKERMPQKQIHQINSKFKNQQFDFKLLYSNSYGVNFDHRAILHDSNVITLIPSLDPNDVADAVSVFSHLHLSIEMHCINKECKHNFYILTSILKPQYDSSIGIYFNPILIDYQCFNLKNLWISNDHVSEVTRIYNINSIKTPPITTSFMPITLSNKDKLFARIQTIVNFG